jgi:hypothetical protein
MSTETTPPRPAGRGRLVLIAVVVAAVAAVVAWVVLSGIHPAPRAPRHSEAGIVDVECEDADGNPAGSWSAGADAPASAPRIDPVAVCQGLYVDHAAVAKMDALATQQRELGRDCVEFADSTGGHWYFTGVVVSQDGTYTASGGPAPGKLPSYGVIGQPAPLATLPPTPSLPPGCVRLPAVEWDLTAPLLAACTGDDTTATVFTRTAAEPVDGLCAARGLHEVKGAAPSR